MNKKLTYQEQIAELSNDGITVDNEAETIQYLKTHVSFYRIKLYADLFPIQRTGKNAGKYLGVSFDHLVELSKLDFYLRHILLSMTIDIEYWAKLKFLNAVTENADCDGFTIVDDFLKDNQKVKIMDGNYPKMGVWNLCEQLSFGDFVYLCEFYNDKYDNGYLKGYDKSCLWFSRTVRNMCAHNTCIIPVLLKQPNKVNHQIVSKICSLTKMTNAEKKLVKESILFMGIVSVFLYFSEIVISESETRKISDDLNNLVNNRFLRHKELFEGNDKLRIAYGFIKKITGAFFPQT